MNPWLHFGHYFGNQALRIFLLAAIPHVAFTHGEGLERTHHDRLIKQKTQWEAQEQERIRKRDEAEKARWAWDRQEETQEGCDPKANS